MYHYLAVWCANGNGHMPLSAHHYALYNSLPTIVQFSQYITSLYIGLLYQTVLSADTLGNSALVLTAHVRCDIL